MKSAAMSTLPVSRQAMQQELPQLTPYFGSGSLVESTLNMGLPAPIDIQISGSNFQGNYKLALDLAQEIRKIQALPMYSFRRISISLRLKLDIDRVRARELGLARKR